MTTFTSEVDNRCLVQVPQNGPKPQKSILNNTLPVTNAFLEILGKLEVFHTLLIALFVCCKSVLTVLCAFDIPLVEHILH